MSEFTKGPWRIGKQFMSPSQKQKVIPIEWESVQCEKCGKSDGYRLIGWVFTQSLPIEQQKANARLITAAPEMAEMLRGKVLAALRQPQAMDIEGVCEDVEE